MSTQPTTIDERKDLVGKIIDMYNDFFGKPPTQAHIAGWTGRTMPDLRHCYGTWREFMDTRPSKQEIVIHQPAPIEAQRELKWN